MKLLSPTYALTLRETSNRPQRSDVTRRLNIRYTSCNTGNGRFPVRTVKLQINTPFNKRPLLNLNPHVGVFSHVFGHISAENGPIFFKPMGVYWGVLWYLLFKIETMHHMTKNPSFHMLAFSEESIKATSLFLIFAIIL